MRYLWNSQEDLRKGEIITYEDFAKLFIKQCRIYMTGLKI